MIFLYTGQARRLHVLRNTLTKGEPFTTDDPRLIEMLSLLVDVEEVKEVEEAVETPQEEPKPRKRRSRKSHAQ